MTLSDISARITHLKMQVIESQFRLERCTDEDKSKQIEEHIDLLNGRLQDSVYAQNRMTVALQSAYVKFESLSDCEKINILLSPDSFESKLLALNT